jgi:predicted transcriptional regulator
MAKKKYRTANIIIQTILEGIIRAERDRSNEKDGIVKSHLIDYCNLKTSTAEKYLSKLINAEYIKSYEEPWGERTINIYKTTKRGRQRYEWFVKINTEMEESI